LKIQEYRLNTENKGEMEREILLEDSLGALHKVKYLDENRVQVQTVAYYVSEFGAEDTTTYGMPAKVRLQQIDSWPFTDDLKTQIRDWHAQFPDAK
jgi:hypothetical protein